MEKQIKEFWDATQGAGVGHILPRDLKGFTATICREEPYYKTVNELIKEYKSNKHTRFKFVPFEDYIVIDIDIKKANGKGQDILSYLDSHPVYSNTLSMKTKSNGRHYVFKYPKKEILHNREGQSECFEFLDNIVDGFKGIDLPWNAACVPTENYSMISGNPPIELKDLSDINLKYSPKVKERIENGGAAIYKAVALPADPSVFEPRVVDDFMKANDIELIESSANETLFSIGSAMRRYFNDTWEALVYIDTHYRDVSSWFRPGFKHIYKNVESYRVDDEVREKEGTPFDIIEIEEIEAIMNDEKPPENKSRFHLFSAKDAMEKQEPIDWLITDLISAGGINMVAGDAGSGKTWLCMDLAVDISLNKSWLDMRVNGGPVLIIDEESGKNRLSRRIGQTLRGKGGGENTPLYYITLERFNPEDKADQLELLNLIKQLNIKVIIIDALMELLSGKDENSVKDITPAFVNMKNIAEITGVTFIIIHHTVKNGKGYRGSSAIRGHVDTLLLIEKIDNTLNIKTDKIRDGEFKEFAAEMNFLPDFNNPDMEDTFKLLMTEISTVNIQENIANKEQEIFDFIAGGGVVQSKEIEKYCVSRGFYKGNTVRTKLQQMVNDGRIESAGRGLYKIAGAF